MATIIGRVVEYDPSNVVVGGKHLFIRPEDRAAAKKNWPVGAPVKVKVLSGTVEEMLKLSQQEYAQLEADEAKAKNQTPGKPDERFVTGIYRGIPGRSIIIEVNLAKDQYSCGAGLRKHLEDPACPIKPGDTVKLGLVDEHRGDGFVAHGIEKVETPKQEPAPVLKTAAELKKDEAAQQPAPKQDTPCTSPAAATGTIKEVTLAVTLNLNNYENIRLEATGSDFATVRGCMIDNLRALGTQSAVTKEIIEKYIARVFGGA